MCSKYQLPSPSPQTFPAICPSKPRRVPHYIVLLYDQSQTPLKIPQKSMLCWELKVMQRKMQIAAKWTTEFLTHTRELVSLFSSLSCSCTFLISFFFILYYALLFHIALLLCPDTQLQSLARLWARGGIATALGFLKHTPNPALLWLWCRSEWLCLSWQGSFHSKLRALGEKGSQNVNILVHILIVTPCVCIHTSASVCACVYNIMPHLEVSDRNDASLPSNISVCVSYKKDISRINTRKLSIVRNNQLFLWRTRQLFWRMFLN